MNQSTIHLVGSLAIACLSIAQPAHAQIIPDATLPTNSQVVPGCTVCTINGGTVRGTNLFHSFQEFSVPTNGTAWFNNAPQIQNILTRVTGNFVSNIDGLIRANGTANLFLLNPNGIIFGPNAQLNVGGSFIATTASSFKFPDGNEFSAVNPQAPPLLAINITPGLQYGRGQAPISNTGNLAVKTGERLTLLGSTVTSSGTLAAPGGTVELLGDRVGLFGNALVDVSSDTGGGTVHIGGSFQGRGPLPNATQTFVGPNVRITADALTRGDGGSVIVWADETTRFYGSVSARGGTQSGNGGLIEISGARNLAFFGTANATAPTGTPGTILFDPTNITIVAGVGGDDAQVADGSILFADGGAADFQIGADAIGSIGGNILLQATNDITFSAAINIPGFGLTAQAGNNITVNAPINTQGGDIQFGANGNISVNGATVITAPLLLGNTGNINIQAGGQLLVQNGGQIGAPTSLLGTAPGRITIQAGEVEVVGIGSGITANSQSLVGGNGGIISINAGRVTVQDGAQIASGTLFSGDAGEVFVQANEINVLGLDSFIGAINTITSTGNAGNVTLNTGQLTVRDGSGVLVSTFNNRSSGELTIQASSVEVSGASFRNPSLLSAGALEGALGDGGTLSISTDRLLVQDGGVVDVSSPVGNSGTLTIQARESVDILRRGGLNGFGVNGGTITVDTKQFTMFGNGQAEVFNNSFVTTVGVGGNAGDLTIRASESVNLLNGATMNALGITLDGIGSGVVNGGRLAIATRNLFLQGGSSITAGVDGQGNGGTILVQASDAVTINNSVLSTVSTGAVTGGDILVETGTLKIQGSDGRSSGISTSMAGSGTAGNIAIRASNAVTIDNGGISTGIIGAGNGGTLSIQTGTLNILPGGFIGTDILDGNILFSANPSEIDSIAVRTVRSIINSDPDTARNVRNALNSGQGTIPQSGSGELTIQATDSINLQQGLISTATVGQTRGGRLRINGGNVTIQDGGTVSSAALSQGSGGDIQLEANTLSLQNGGRITSRGDVQGRAGDILVRLNNTLQTNNGEITATSDRAGGGNIDIAAQDIRLRGSSLISTSVFDSTGGGGNININSRIFLALEDSDILANAELGPGGNITITSPVFLANLFATGQATSVGRNPGSFGRFRGNGRVDISVDSASGSSGQLNLPNIETGRGLVPLPANLVDASQLIDQSCEPKRTQATSSFVSTGRGGLPPSPTGVLGGETVIRRLATLEQEPSGQSATAPDVGKEKQPVEAIVEAQGWTIAPNGEVTLVANAPNGQAIAPSLPLPNCQPR